MESADESHHGKKIGIRRNVGKVRSINRVVHDWCTWLAEIVNFHQWTVRSAMGRYAAYLDVPRNTLLLLSLSHVTQDNRMPMSQEILCLFVSNDAK